MPASKSRGRRKLGHTFLRINIGLESGKIKASKEVFAEAVGVALTGLYGIIGGAINWDLIDFQKENCVAIIRCRAIDEERIWAAAGFMTQLKGLACRLQVLESSPFLVTASSLDPDLVETQ